MDDLLGLLLLWAHAHLRDDRWLAIGAAETYQLRVATTGAPFAFWHGTHDSVTGHTPQAHLLRIRSCTRGDQPYHMEAEDFLGLIQAQITSDLLGVWDALAGCADPTMED